MSATNEAGNVLNDLEINFDMNTLISSYITHASSALKKLQSMLDKTTMANSISEPGKQLLKDVSEYSKEGVQPSTEDMAVMSKVAAYQQRAIVNNTLNLVSDVNNTARNVGGAVGYMPGRESLERLAHGRLLLTRAVKGFKMTPPATIQSRDK